MGLYEDGDTFRETVSKINQRREDERTRSSQKRELKAAVFFIAALIAGIGIFVVATRPHPITPDELLVHRAEKEQQEAREAAAKAREVAAAAEWQYRDGDRWAAYALSRVDKGGAERCKPVYDRSTAGVTITKYMECDWGPHERYRFR